MILDHQYELDMIVKQLTLISKPREGQDQIDEALVFTTNSTGLLNKFDLKTLGNHAQYKKWLNSKASKQERIEEYEPAGYLNIVDSQAIVSLDVVRPARYICLVFKTKLNKSNFSFNFVGAKGSATFATKTHSIEVNKQTDEGVETGYELTVLNHETSLTKARKITLDNRHRHSTKSVLNVNFYEDIKELIVEVDRLAESCYSLESIDVSVIKCGSGSDKGLKEIFENRSKLVELVNLQSAKISNDSVGLDEKKQILNMFSNIIQSYDTKLVNEISQSLDVDYIVTKLILRETDLELLSKINSLFEVLGTHEVFNSKLLAVLSKSIDNIDKIETNPESLKNFFKLLDSILHNEKYISLAENIKNLVSNSIGKLQETSSREYRLLRHLGYETCCFDETCFWNVNSNRKQANSSDDFSNFLPMEQLSVQSMTQVEVYCDLGKQISLDRLLINFNAITRPNADIFAYVQVFQAELSDGRWDHSKETLLFTREVSHSFIFYCAKTARDQALQFYHQKDHFNCIGYRMNGAKGRYFKVRLTFDVSKHGKQLYKLKQSIEPLFYGTSTDQTIVESTKTDIQTILPAYTINTTAKASAGEVVVEKKSIKNAAATSKSTKIEAPSAGISEGPSAEEVNQQANKQSLQALNNSRLLLRECLASVKGEVVGVDEGAHISEIADGICKLREENQESQSKNSIGGSSFNFWLSIIDLAGNSHIMDKVHFSLTLNHF